MATTTHGEVRGAFLVVAGEGHETAMCGQHRVHIHRNDGFDLCRGFVISNQALHRRRLGSIRISQHQSGLLAVVELRASQRFNVTSGHDEFETIDGANFVGECRLQKLLEDEVVTEVFTRCRNDGESQTELFGVGLGGTKFLQFGERSRGHGNDGVARTLRCQRRVRCRKWRRLGFRHAPQATEPDHHLMQCCR